MFSVGPIIYIDWELMNKKTEISIHFYNFVPCRKTDEKNL